MLRFLGFINRSFGKLGSFFQSPVLLALRLFFGIGFIIAGFGKLMDISKFADYLITFNVPYPEASAWLAALSETIGGALLTVGFLSRIAAIPLIIVMVTAYSTAHVDSVLALLHDPELFFKEPPFNFLLTALLVFAFGPGYFSLDAFLLENKEKAEPKA